MLRRSAFFAAFRLSKVKRDARVQCENKLEKNEKKEKKEKKGKCTTYMA